VAHKIPVRARDRGADTPTDASPGHAMQTHQTPDLFDVHDDAAVAQLTVHSRDSVVAFGGVEDLTDQRDQLGLGDLAIGRLRSLTLTPVVEPDVDTSVILHAAVTGNPAAFWSTTHS